MKKQRIDKFISNQLLISRSEARVGIRRGQATVNGDVIRDASRLVEPQTDNVTYNGQTVGYKEYVYILINKPQGVLSASTDKSRETVVDLVPEHLKRRELSPVGRLDKDTTGLLIITDDGAFAHDIISPKKNISKSYIAGLDGDVTDEMVALFKDGVVLADGTKCKPAVLQSLSQNTARITITEGKYHQIKRMFGTVGLGVNTLHREAIGGLTLPNNLHNGDCIEMTKQQLIDSILHKNA
ncbi:MAG: pseudouridine synthase [Clostridia bacterium]|nr:pseudouridine synthase [Clostridia bacterium]